MIISPPDYYVACGIYPAEHTEHINWFKLKSQIFQELRPSPRKS